MSLTMYVILHVTYYVFSTLEAVDFIQRKGNLRLCFLKVTLT